jgi:hypothetical protein
MKKVALMLGYVDELEKMLDRKSSKFEADTQFAAQSFCQALVAWIYCSR